MTRLSPAPSRHDARTYHHLDELSRDRAAVASVAGALVVLVGEPEELPLVARLIERCLEQLEKGIEPTEPSSDLEWGRMVRALGTAAVHAPLALTRRRAMRAFLHGAERRSVDPAAMAEAAIGAGEVLSVRPHSESARGLIDDAVVLLGARTWTDADDGTVAEALVLCGQALEDRELVGRGLELLGAILQRESTSTGLDCTGAGEVAAIVASCSRAFEVAHEERWLDGVRKGWAWFGGANPASAVLFDVLDGSGRDAADDGQPDGDLRATVAGLSVYNAARRHGTLN